MPQNPIEHNPVTRFILGYGVIMAMFIGGAIGAQLFTSIGFPFVAWVGVPVGGIAVFVAFAAWYTRYDASFDDE